MIVLASQSASRKAMLDAAGIAYEARPAHLDERAIEAQLDGASSEAIAVALAKAKAIATSGECAGRIVLGSDSLVEVVGCRFDKPASKADAADHLRFFSGKAMHLFSAAALVRDGDCIWSDCAHATLHLAELSDAFIADYLDHEWPAVAGCVGVFRIEGRGVQLFTQIEGDQFTVLGMPLLKVIAELRRQGELAT